MAVHGKSKDAIGKAFLRFVNDTGSPYHSAKALSELLVGFQKLHEGEEWKLEKGGRYYVIRNGSAIAAFVVGKEYSGGGFSLVATHTDSPCLRLRPNSHVTASGFMQLGVECYGGGLWHTWFDRGLGLAGKVVLRESKTDLVEHLVKIDRPIAILPNLAIHLQTAEERQAFKVHKENNLHPIICSIAKHELLFPVSPPNVQSSQDKTGDSGRKEVDGSETQEASKSKESAKCSLPLLNFLASTLQCKAEAIVDADLCLLDATPGRLCGLYEEFIEAPRLDNLASSFAAFQALSETPSAPDDSIIGAVALDHEEIGSETWAGAASSALEVWLKRLHGCFAPEARMPETMAHSFLISADMAHGVHPNYSDKHQKEHQPAMHQGIVLKENSNQRYTSQCTSMAITRQIASLASVPVQEFVVRNDAGCGSTVGPMMASRLGIRAVDIGICQWAMHSCRELCGVEDLTHLLVFFKAFYSHYPHLRIKHAQ